MPKRFWFVIEGDNGAGKDSLAERLIGDGWFLGNRILEINAQKERASRLSGIARVRAFMLYNEMCGELISAHPSRSFLVRYWPSTLAAAFADAIFEWAEIETEVDFSLRQLPAPALFLFLTCGLDTRRNRVKNRGMVPGAVDDISEDRDNRYRESIRRLAEYPGVGNWKSLDTTELNTEQVYQSVRKMLVDMEVLS